MSTIMLLNKLQNCGLTNNEAQIYLALLQKKEFIASELSDLTSVGRTRVYELIPLMVAKGLCMELQKNGKKFYSALPPNLALQNLIAFHKEENDRKLSQEIELIKEFESDLETIYLRNNEKEHEVDYIEILRDSAQIRKKYQNLQENVQYEMLSFTKPPYFTMSKENIPILKSAVTERKIRMRCIYETSENISLIPSLNEFIETIQLYVDASEEARMIERLPMKLVIMDEKITMLTMNDPIAMKPSITTLVVTHPDFAHIQKEVFESYWAKAMLFDEFKEKYYDTSMIQS